MYCGADPVWALAWLASQPCFLFLSLTFLICTSQGLCDQLPPQNEEKTTAMMLTSGRPFQPHSFNVFNAGGAVVIGESRPCPLTQKPGH